MLWQHFERSFLPLVVSVGFLLTSSPVTAESQPTPPSKNLNLYLPAIYTAVPEGGFKTDLNIAQQPRSTGTFKGIKTKKTYPFGYQQIKADKTIRIRGWEVKEGFYLGQAKVGGDWGIGMMYTRGNFAYGMNSDGVGLVYNGENSVYRLNMEEISFKIDF